MNNNTRQKTLKVNSSHRYRLVKSGKRWLVLTSTLFSGMLVLATTAPTLAAVTEQVTTEKVVSVTDEQATAPAASEAAVENVTDGKTATEPVDGEEMQPVASNSTPTTEVKEEIPAATAGVEVQSDSKTETKATITVQQGPTIDSMSSNDVVAPVTTSGQLTTQTENTSSLSNVAKSSTSTNMKQATAKATGEDAKTTTLATELKQLGYTATEIQERIDQYGSILDDKHVIETMMELTKNHKHKVTNAASLIYYLENNPLFIASLFHLFGNTIVTGAHTSGNIAGKDVTLNHAAGSDNKTQKILWELFYIQASLQGENLANLGNGKTTADGGVKNNKVVIGSGVDGDITINGQGQYEYNGHRFDKLSEIDGDIVFKESISDNPLINFEAVFAKLKSNSDAWQADTTNHGSYLDRDGKEKTVNYISNDDFSDNNQRVLDVSKFKTNDQNQMIINLGADVLSQSTQLIFKNYQQLVEDGVSLIINVDTSQSEQYDVQSQIILGGIPGGDANNDNKAFSNNNILWNFLSQTNNPLTVNFSSGRMLGSILAVNQVTKIIGGVNIDGNIVANHIELNGESHRWDLQTPNTETDYETPGET